jgi:acylphosphatase
VAALRLRIDGLVQGVFFRAESKKKADALGLTGWVRNTDDGCVEIHAEGTVENLAALKEWCRRGPPNARVKEVTEIETSEEQLAAFDIR